MPFFLEYPPPKGFHSWNIIARILFYPFAITLISTKFIIQKIHPSTTVEFSEKFARSFLSLLIKCSKYQKKKKRKEKTRLASKLRYRINFLPIFRLSFQFFTRGLALQLIIRYCREKICSQSNTMPISYTCSYTMYTQ